MRENFPSNSAIKESIRLLSPELRKRYGLSGGCTRAQVIKTIGDLGLENDIIPYLSALFMKKDEFQQLQGEMTSVNWEEVENRSARIFGELLHTRDDGGHFRESGIGHPVDGPR